MIHCIEVQLILVCDILCCNSSKVFLNFYLFIYFWLYLVLWLPASGLCLVLVVGGCTWLCGRSLSHRLPLVARHSSGVGRFLVSCPTAYDILLDQGLASDSLPGPWKSTMLFDDQFFSLFWVLYIKSCHLQNKR